MSPLGQQVALLLAPEHWEEWFTTDDQWVIRHRPTWLALYFGDRLDVLGVRARLGWWEKQKLLRMANRLRKHLRRVDSEEAAEILRVKMMTAEERAIEELLKS